MATNAHEARQEAERYRQAAEHALDQLDWCIGYLHEIRKGAIARALSKNRTSIRGDLREAERAASGHRAAEGGGGS